MSECSMSKADNGDTMRDEYEFDYAQSRPNRFASGFRQSSIAVVLDPDVASVFTSAESVNSLLRSVIAALPETKKTSPSADGT